MVLRLKVVREHYREGAEPSVELSATRLSRERLDRELACRGWYAGDLARAAGVSAATISGARRGGRMAPLTLRRIVTALSRAPASPGVAEILDPWEDQPSTASTRINAS